MGARSVTTHAGAAFAFAALALAVVGPAIAIPTAHRMRSAEDFRHGLRAVHQVEAALERGERADAAADRIGGLSGFRVVLFSREGRRIGDTAHDGTQLDRDVPPAFAALVPEVRAQGVLERAV